MVLIHGSGPGVTSYANWRLVIPALAENFHVVAPDMVGFGYSDRPDGVKYGLDTWADQTVGVMDALGIEKANLVGNSFGGAIALRIATKHPDRVDKLVLMGSMGVHFPITEGLDKVWGYDGTIEDMRTVLDYFAYSRELVNEELAQVRYKASIEPGFQEAFSSMFPAPRQRWVDAMTTPEEEIRALPHRTLIVHGREDKVIPVANSYKLDGAAGQRRPVGVLALRALVDDRADRRLQPAGPRLLPEVPTTPVITGERRVGRRGHQDEAGTADDGRRPAPTCRIGIRRCCSGSTR